ncbi:hypothetical protein F4779DRAFT_569606 [Xylariaceae sp. FL0662B]|nr:hypothetical protein F4779DRAFT_569606 [Xylariaceae sp. FL0662B]
MALTVKHLNSDASFLLSFEPIIPESVRGAVVARPFTILLDPWITGPSKIFHSKISITTHKHPACISSLSELPSTPDLVVISQHKSDHCNEATLRQLPASGSKTLILAEPASARLIRSWKYFDADKIRTIERWEDPRVTGKQSVLRIPVPPVAPDCQGGEVTVAFIPQKRDISGLHAAIGITYRPPPTHNLSATIPIGSKLPTPPATPSSTNTLSAPESFLLPPSPPVSPHSLRSVQSASTLLSSPTHPGLNPQQRPTSSHYRSRPATASNTSRPLSLIFSPHGISYTNLAPYATSHLVAEAALPLTALLHCMDSISNPWWLGGNISAGVPAGAEIATCLGARIWLSAHDGEKDVRGLATGMLKTKRWRREEVEVAVHPVGEDKNHNEKLGHARVASKGGSIGTEIMRLSSGDEVAVSANGMVWCSCEKESDQWVTDDTTKPDDRECDTPKPIDPNNEKYGGRLKAKKSTRNGLSMRFKAVA